MPSYNPFATLPPISFSQTDVQALQAAVIRGFQEAWLADTGETLTLTLADRRTNFLLSLVAYLVQERQLIDQSAKQNLLPFSQNGFLDNLAVIFGPLAARLGPAAALVSLTFTLDAVNPSASSLIPAGTTVQSSSTSLVFATEADLIIPAGYNSGFMTARCTETGSAGNGLLDINTLVGWTGAFTLTVSQTEPSAGGAETESDEAYRLRLFGITDTYSPAGPKARYKGYAQAVSPAITDVSVMGPEDGLQPGRVLVTVLMEDGAYPTEAVLSEVYAALNGDTVRDFTSYLTVSAPSGVAFSTSVRWWSDASYTGNITSVSESVSGAVNAWITDIETGLGGAINPATLSRAVLDAGASYCIVDSPPARIPLALNQVGALVDDPIVNYMGAEQDLQA